jgi:hypothetical protein
VHHHRLAAAAKTNIKLDAVGAAGFGQAKGGQSVFRRFATDTAMRQIQQPAIEKG